MKEDEDLDEELVDMTIGIVAVDVDDGLSSTSVSTNLWLSTVLSELNEEFDDRSDSVVIGLSLSIH